MRIPSNRPILALAFLAARGVFAQTAPPSQPAPAQQLEVTAPAATVLVRNFRFTGNTVFSSAELNSVVTEYVGRELAFEQLDDARRKVTQYYIDRGYVTSGAILPVQSIADGEVLIQVIEGRLERLDISGNKELTRDYFAQRLAPALQAPLRIDAIKDEMEILQQNPRVTSLQGKLLPGSELGLAVYDLNIQEAQPWRIGFQFDNAGTPSTGAERLAVVASHLNLTGVGDTLSLRYGPMAGGVAHPKFAPANDIAAQYTRPIFGDSTSVTLFFARNDLSLLEPPLSTLGSETTTDSMAVALQQTLWQTPRNKIDLTLTLSRRDNQTSLLGRNFSFAEGAVDGWMHTTALRTAIDWTTRSDTYVLSFKSELSIGLDALGATIHSGDIPDSRFISWLGQAQQAWRLESLNATLLARESLQFADRHLLALEQYALGGNDSVRGYRESTLLRDDASLLSLELRHPLLSLDKGFSVDGAIFSDFGYGWDHGLSSRGKLLSSVGMGLLFNVTSHVRGEIYWGIPLSNRPHGDDLQDLGIHFQIVVEPF